VGADAQPSATLDPCGHVALKIGVGGGVGVGAGVGVVPVEEAFVVEEFESSEELIGLQF
jgi:hypothetical protein